MWFPKPNYFRCMALSVSELWPKYFTFILSSSFSSAFPSCLLICGFSEVGTAPLFLPGWCVRIICLSCGPGCNTLRWFLVQRQLPPSEPLILQYSDYNLESNNEENIQRRSGNPNHQQCYCLCVLNRQAYNSIALTSIILIVTLCIGLIPKQLLLTSTLCNNCLADVAMSKMNWTKDDLAKYPAHQTISINTHWVRCPCAVNGLCSAFWEILVQGVNWPMSQLVLCKIVYIWNLDITYSGAK